MAKITLETKNPKKVKCIYCGRTSIEDGVKLVIEHIYPVSKGGTYELFNLITACNECNLSKTNILMDNETILKLWEISFDRTQSFGTDNFEQLKKRFDKEVIYKKDKTFIHIT
jgi:5-methylcytosine-specific restriction endonuclease McrA